MAGCEVILAQLPGLHRFRHRVAGDAQPGQPPPFFHRQCPERRQGQVEGICPQFQSNLGMGVGQKGDAVPAADALDRLGQKPVIFLGEVLFS